MSEFKPCPWCSAEGTNPLLHEGSCYINLLYFALQYGTSEIKIVGDGAVSDAWNNRPNEERRRVENEAMRTKLELFETLTDNFWELVLVEECHDCDKISRWVVVSSYIVEPHKRVIGVSSGEDDAEQAIIDAINTTKDDEYAYLFAYV